MAIESKNKNQQKAKKKERFCIRHAWAFIFLALDSFLAFRNLAAGKLCFRLMRSQSGKQEASLSISRFLTWAWKKMMRPINFNFWMNNYTRFGFVHSELRSENLLLLKPQNNTTISREWFASVSRAAFIQLNMKSTLIAFWTIHLADRGGGEANRRRGKITIFLFIDIFFYFFFASQLVSCTKYLHMLLCIQRHNQQ